MSVIDFYDNKNIFVTGATGFLGKFVIEKLIRATNVNKIFILIRDKRGISFQDRFQEFKQEQVFKFRCDKIKLDNVLIPICGDVLETGLGLDEQSKIMLADKIDIVIHCAASVRFNEPLTDAIKMNLFGSLKILEISSTFSGLLSFVHVSTAFVNSHLAHIGEDYHPVHLDNLDLNQLLESFLDDNCQEETDKIKQVIKDVKDNDLAGHPNTYTLSKNLTEQLMISRSRLLSIPLIIVRPAIVTPPIDLIFDNYNDKMTQSAALVVMNFGLALITNQLGDKNAIIPFIPVDKVANLILIAGFKVANDNLIRSRDTNGDKDKELDRKVPIIVSCEDKYRIKMSDYNLWVADEAIRYPSAKLFRIPDKNHKLTNIYYGDWKSNLVHKVNYLIFDLSFAILIDVILFVITFGKSAMLISRSRYVSKIKEKLDQVSFFASQQWPVHGDRLLSETLSSLSDRDKQVFDTYDEVKDRSDKDHQEQYMRRFWRGVLKYQLSEDEEQLILARKRFMRLQIAHFIIKIILITFISILFSIFLL